MTRDIIDINDFTILVETSAAEETSVDSCVFEEPLIAVAFYGSGNVNLSVRYGEKQKDFSYTKSMALSFYADDQVEFIHTVSAQKPLRCIVIATAPRNLQQLPHHEGELFSQLLSQLVNPADHYVEGPLFYMTPEIQTVVDQVFENQYQGKAKMMFFRSQMTLLLAHFFGQLSSLNEVTSSSGGIKNEERERLYQAKEILTANLENPPSLTELSRQIGLNSFKLKKDFKALFGVPVFKYLQNERLTRAHTLLRNQDVSIQEAAWHVGYDSLSSFSNAFVQKFGFRPSEVKR
ncbi:helix-turn-helix transcriptional regulator [Tunicatimonas pelagia]|uniref:helix-turn-helix transcriptional regulator n=1 Tax=Tunicatimonas pelagia TaxID=931531 RepID=UPI002666699C|nr:AraC family transcriptional regulator [Tunicatimonas pelagia]WKN43670.1 AraC family transcriptional regulator [Tunicatimonas pelagia]